MHENYSNIIQIKRNKKFLYSLGVLNSFDLVLILLVLSWVQRGTKINQMSLEPPWKKKQQETFFPLFLQLMNINMHINKDILKRNIYFIYNIKQVAISYTYISERLYI